MILGLYSEAKRLFRKYFSYEDSSIEIFPLRVSLSECFTCDYSPPNTIH